LSISATLVLISSIRRWSCGPAAPGSIIAVALSGIGAADVVVRN